MPVRLPVESWSARVCGAIWRWYSQLTCSHRWVRARWDDGRYGLRCGACMKLYPMTWNDLLVLEVPGHQASVVPLVATAARSGPVPVESQPARRPMVA